MANQLEKFGLRPYRKLDGTPLVGAQNRYTIKPGYGTAIYQGDLVIPVSTGNIERHTAGNGAAVVGVFNGCFYTDPTTQKPTYKNYYPGSVAASDITAFVVDDPDAVFSGFSSLKDIAIGSGFGLRYDFSFFVFRFDLGFKTYDPSYLNNDRWFNDYNFGNAVYNIGINYPF